MDFSAATLLVVDVQRGIDELGPGQRNNPQAEDNIERLINAWRDSAKRIVHVKHNSVSPGSPLRPEHPGNAFKPQALPVTGEDIFEKTVNSAFIGTGLEQHLKENNISSLVIVGLTTDHCVSTTTRMAGNLGFDVALVSDATATFAKTGPDGNVYDAEQVHQINLSSLDGEFCQVVTTENVLAAF